MTNELWILTGAILLGLIHLTFAALSYKFQVGVIPTLGQRDNDTAPMGLAGRFERAFRNYRETFPFFLAATLLNHFADISNLGTVGGGALYIFGRALYLPCYALAVPWLRTVFWCLATGGLAVVSVQPFLA